MKKILLFLMFALFCIPWAANAQETLTVHDGTNTSSYIPHWGLWADNGLQSEMVYPATELSDMTGGSITNLHYYSNGTSNITSWDGTCQIFMMEIESTSLSEFAGPTDATVVYNGPIALVNGEMTIELSTPYNYGGGNLLVGFYYTTGGSYASVYWLGETVSGASIYGRSGNSYSVTAGDFLPKTTFTYEPASTGCDMPTSIAVNNITTDGAIVTWEGDGSAWNLRYKASADADFTMVNGLTSQTYTFTGLNGNTTYSVGVQTVCTGSTSTFRSTSFTTANPCAAPTNFVASNITGNSATISWTAGYQETAWTVKYKKSSESSWDNATSVSVNGTPTTNLTGLDGLTVYNVMVLNCTGESDPYLTGNFTTSASFPYSQDFSGSTSIPTGWAQYSGLLANVMTGTALTSGYGWYIGTSNGVLDGNHIYANIYNTGCNKWVVTPAIPVESGARLTFDVAYTAYSGTAANPQTTGTDDKFVVLASTDNMATWTILRQWDNAGSEFVLNELTPATLHQIFDLADYAGQNVIVAFYGESTESNADNNIHVDNVVFELVPSCEKPTNLAVNYTGGTSATVTWTGDATQYNIKVNGTVTNNVTSPYALSDLDLATTYTVSVQAVCDGNNSEWTNDVSFTTDMCLPENMCELTFVLTDSYGDGWNGNAIQIKDVLTNTVLATLTNQDLDGTNGEETQTVTLAVCDGRAIQFQYVVSGTYSYPDENSWVIKDVNGEVIWEFESPSASMSQNYTMSCAVNSCRKPTDLAVSEVGPNSAVLNWTENGEATAWNIMIGENLIESVTKPYTLTNLTPETEYTVKVTPVCEVEKWSDDFTFTTAVSCPVPSEIDIEPAAEEATVTWTGFSDSYNLRYRTPRGFNYGFEQAEAWTYTDFDPCTVYDGDGGTTYGLSGYTFTNQNYVGACIAFQNGINDNFAAHNGNAFGVMFNSADGQSNDWFILPELAIASGDVFSFWGREITTQYGDETINVGIYGSSDGTFASLLAENVAVSTTEFTKFEYDLSEYAGQTIRLAINCVSNDVFGFMFDDIFVGNPNDDTWDYVVETVSSPYEITELTPETDYELQVQAVCGEEEESEWSNTFSFTTLPLCEVPTNVTVANITTNSAVVSWESEAASFDLELNGDVIADVASPYDLNLEPGTAYSVRVRANCGETGYSAWTTAVNFQTPCLAFDLPYEYGFETADDMGCWNVMAANSANLLGRINVTAQGIDDFAAYDGDYAFVFSSYNSTDAYDQILISPELSNTENGVRVQFAYRVYGSGTEDLYVLYSTTTDDLEEFVQVDEVEANNTDEWLQYQTTLPAGTKYVALYYASNFQYYLFVDGFSFTEPVACDPIVLTEGTPEDWTFEGITEETTPATGVTLDCWTWTRTVDLPENYEYEADELPQLYYNSEFASGGDYSLRLWTRGVLAMPMLDETVDIQRVKMSFSSRHSFSLYTMMVGVMDAPDDPSTFVPVAYVDNGSSTGVEFFEFDFSSYTGTGRYIAFKNVRRAAGELDAESDDVHSVNYIDDIHLELMPETTCTIELADLPITENFDNITSSTHAATGASPRCWKVVEGSDNMTLTTAPQVYYGAGFAQSGNYSLRMLNRGIYAMPALAEDLDIHTIQLSMYVLQPNARYQLEVGVWEENEAGEGTFVPVALVNNSTTGMERFTCDFANYDGEGGRIAFRNTLNGGKEWAYSYNYIDDVTLSAKAACQEISETYTESFETVTDLQTAETHLSPSCWEVVYEDVEDMAYGYPQVYYGSAYAKEGDYSLQMSNRCVYAMPELADEVELSSLSMNLSVLQPTIYYQLEVGVWNGTEFTVVKTINNPNTEMTDVTVDFAGYDEGRIAFRNTLNRGKEWNYSYNYIDKISFEATTEAKSEAVEGGLNNAMDSERYLENIAVYPNPTTGMLYIDAVGVQKVECYSQMGQLVGVYDNVNELNISELADGVYMLRITVPQGVTMRKVVKK